MSFSTIRPLVVTLLESVTDIGVVYNQPRWSAKPTTDIIRLFKSGGRLHTWFIMRPAITPNEAMTSGLVRRTHAVEFHGLMAMEDGVTYTLMSDLCDTILDKFDARSNIVLTDGVCMLPPAELRELVDVEWLGVLCWRAIIDLQIQEHQVIT